MGVRIQFGVLSRNRRGVSSIAAHPLVLGVRLIRRLSHRRAGSPH